MSSRGPKYNLLWVVYYILAGAFIQAKFHPRFYFEGLPFGVLLVEDDGLSYLLFWMKWGL